MYSLQFWAKVPGSCSQSSVVVLKNELDRFFLGSQWDQTVQNNQIFI